MNNTRLGLFHGVALWGTIFSLAILIFTSWQNRFGTFLHSEISLDSNKFKTPQGNAILYSLPREIHQNEHTRYYSKVYEDQTTLKRADYKREVTSQGKGQYWIKDRSLWIASTDGSNPQTNQKKYRISIPHVFSSRTTLFSQLIFLTFLSTALIFNFQQVRARKKTEPKSSNLKKSSRIFDPPKHTSLELLCLLMAPFLAFFIFRYNIFLNYGSLDANFYTSYIYQFEELFNRYGPTYYSVRFSAILPGYLLNKVFSPFFTYCLIRYLLCLLLILPTYFTIKKRFSARAAIFTVIYILSNPLTARFLLNDYTEAYGVTFTALGICLVLGATSFPRTLLSLTLGFLAGLSIHSNIFAVVYWAFIGLIFCIRIAYENPIRQLSDLKNTGLIFIKESVNTLAGFTIVYLIGLLFFKLTVDYTSYLNPTIAVLENFTHHGAGHFKKAYSEWIFSLHVVYLPLFLIFTFALLLIKNKIKDIYVTSVFIFLFSIEAFLIIFEFALGGNVLEHSFYFAYSLPSIYLSAGSIFHIIDLRFRVFNLVGILLIILPSFIWSLDIVKFDTAPWAITCIITLLFPFLISSLQSNQKKRRISLVIFTLSIAYFVFATKEYDRVYKSQNNATAFFYLLHEFIDTVNDQVSPSERVLFWYQPEDRLLNSIQASFLWSYSTLHPGKTGGLSEIGSFEKEKITYIAPHYLIVLTTENNAIDIGLETLSKNEIKFSIKDQIMLSKENLRVVLHILKL